MIRVIAFDLWGTLAYRDVGYSTTRRMLAATGARITPSRFVKVFENSLQTKKWKSKYRAYKALCRNMGLRGSAQNVNLLRAIRDRAEAKTKLYAHTIPMLSELRDQKYEIGLVSNSSVFDVKQVRKKTSLLTHMDFTVFSFDVGVVKPNPAVFRRLLSITSRKPEEVIMVGDKLRDDIEPARRIGINAIHFVSFRELKKKLRTLGVRINLELSREVTG